MSVKSATPPLRGKMMIAAFLLLGAGCAHLTPEQAAETATVNLELRAMAIHEARIKRANGMRVWCVPFARDMSGVDIRGNANTWWSQAAGEFDRTRKPQVGSVMAFAGTRGMPMGHVAVVSEVVSDREIKIDHANWHRNRISLGMSVIDVSDKNDWSRVKVETNPGAYGSVYPVNGFILPNDV
jgi:hypothetical protein